jgi:hypothetical protein
MDDVPSYTVGPKYFCCGSTVCICLCYHDDTPRKGEECSQPSTKSSYPLHCVCAMRSAGLVVARSRNFNRLRDLESCVIKSIPSPAPASRHISQGHAPSSTEQQDLHISHRSRAPLIAECEAQQETCSLLSSWSSFTLYLLPCRLGGLTVRTCWCNLTCNFTCPPLSL